MMLVGDLALIEDPNFRKYVEIYAKDQTKFFNDFAKAFQKLEELGVPYECCGLGPKEYALIGAGVLAVGAAVAYGASRK